MLFPCLEQLALSHLPGLSWNISPSWKDCWFLIRCSPLIDTAMAFLLLYQPALCWDGLFAWLGFLWLTRLKGDRRQVCLGRHYSPLPSMACPVQSRCSVDFSWVTYGNNETAFKGGISGGLRNQAESVALGQTRHASDQSWPFAYKIQRNILQYHKKICIPSFSLKNASLLIYLSFPHV